MSQIVGRTDKLLALGGSKGMLHRQSVKHMHCTAACCACAVPAVHALYCSKYHVLLVRTGAHSLLLCWHAQIRDGIVSKAQLLTVVVRIVSRASWLVLQDTHSDTAQHKMLATRHNT